MCWGWIQLGSSSWWFACVIAKQRAHLLLLALLAALPGVRLLMWLQGGRGNLRPTCTRRLPLSQMSSDGFLQQGYLEVNREQEHHPNEVVRGFIGEQP